LTSLAAMRSPAFGGFLVPLLILVASNAKGGSMRRAALLLTLLCAVAASVPGTASADQPTVVVAPISMTQLNTQICSFPVTVVASGERRTTFFSDGRVVTHRRVTVTYSANGKTLENNQTATFIDEAGMRTVVGNVFSFNVPGEGVVLQGTGNVFFDLANPNDFLFEAGPHDPISLICGYLAP
jgi:hypothetical protein